MKKHTGISITLIVLLSCLPVGVAISGQEMVPVIIMFRDGKDLGLIRGLGGRVKSVYRFQPAVAAEIPEAAMEALGKNPAIRFVVPDLEIELVQTTPWGVERIGAPTVHSSENKGAGINVAVLDTGIDKDHPDLSYVYGYDFSGTNDEDPEDYYGHGTHVAGTVAALDNTIGVVGVAPEANLYILKVFYDDGAGYYSDTIEALEWCIGTYEDVEVGNEIQVISMSFGSNVAYGDPGIESWINQAYGLGILLVGAAGNEGTPPGRGDNVIYPARYENVIAVAATDESDERAKWSSTGPSVELSAPGVSILSTYLGGGYAYASGTSMACPHVSGTAALILRSDEGAWVTPGYTNGDGNWTSSEVRTVLAMTADNLGSTGRDTKYGHGLVDADEAAAAPGEDTTPPTISDLTPADGATVNTATPTISATVTDASGIDADSIVMTVDEDLTTHTYDSITGLVSYIVPTAEPLLEGIHTVTLDVLDTVGNPATASWSFTVDTTPPAQVAGVTVTTVSSNRLDVSWTANTEPDLDHYDVYRSTMSGGPYDLVASLNTDSYSDTGLTASTTYYYIVTAVDSAGNEGTPSSEASGTTSETPALPTMHVVNIDMSLKTAGINTNAIATVTIVDASGKPVEGATVYGYWEIATTDSDSGITDASGQVSLESDKVKRAASETTFKFVVDRVELSGWTYNPSANSETSDSITTP